MLDDEVDGLDLLPPPDSSPLSPALAPIAGPSNLEDSSTAPPPKKRGNTIGARITALTLFDKGVNYMKVIARTEISRSRLYKLREKAVSRD